MNVAMLELKNNLLALPAHQRAFLARELWSSLVDTVETEGLDAFDEAEKRNQELRDGSVIGRTHDQVMASMHQRLK